MTPRALLLILAALAPLASATTVTLKGSSYTLQEGPIGLLDGPCDEGVWSAGTAYHSLQAVTFGGLWYRAIAQSTGVTPGTDGTKWLVSALNLSGSGARFTCQLWRTTGSGKAQVGNPAYAATKNGADAMIASTYAASAGADINWHGVGQNSGNIYGNSLNCALQWAAAGAPDSSPYLSCALNAILNAEDFQFGKALCDQTTNDCGTYFAYTDYSSYYQAWLGQIYSIVRDKLTAGQRTTFMNKVWNDKAQATNGLGTNGAPTVACTPAALKSPAAGTVTYHSYVVWALAGGHPVSETLTITGSGTSFTTQVTAGDMLYGIGHVASVTDNLHLQLTAPAADDGSGIALSTLLLSAWNDADNTCGEVFYTKFHPASPPVGTGVYSTSYPTTGGTFASGFGNLTMTKLAGYIPLALATAHDDARARTALTLYYDYWYDNSLSPQSQSITGYYRSNGYTSGRWQWMSLQVVHALQNSVLALNTAPFKGVWAREIMPFWYAGSFIDSVVGPSPMPWGGVLQDNPYGVRDVLMSAALFPGTAESSLSNYWQKTTLGNYSASAPFNPYSQQSNSQQAGQLFIYSDPGISGSGVPSTTQYIFDRTDLVPNGGPTASATACSYYITVIGDCRLNYWVSHSNFTPTGTTVMMQNPWYDGLDHQAESGPAWLTTSIYNQGFLLAGSGQQGDGTDAYSSNKGMIEIGGAGNWKVAVGALGWGASELRWAGTHPGGVASSKYAYGCFDAKTTYISTVTNAIRCVAHMKGTAQDYVHIYDYVSVPVGTTIKSIWPFYIGPDVFGRTATATITSWTSTKTAQSVNAFASVIATGLSVAGASSLAAVNPATGVYAKLVHLCASANGTTCSSSATSMESVVIAKPAASVSPTMPTLTQLSSGDSNWTITQVADSSSPNVVAFARGTSTQTLLNFTSTHSGTAGYLIAGLAAGSYSVTLNGTPIATCTAPAGDNSCYFESTAGAIQVGTGTPPTTLSGGTLGGKLTFSGPNTIK